MTEAEQKAWIQQYWKIKEPFDVEFDAINDFTECRVFALTMATAWMFEFGFTGNDQGFRIFARHQKYFDTLLKLQTSLNYISAIASIEWKIQRYDKVLHSHAKFGRDVLLWLARNPLTRLQSRLCNELGHVLHHLVVHLDTLNDTLKVSEIEPNSVENGEIFTLNLEDE